MLDLSRYEKRTIEDMLIVGLVANAPHIPDWFMPADRNLPTDEWIEMTRQRIFAWPWYYAKMVINAMPEVKG